MAVGDTETLAARIGRVAHLTGEFTLRSGVIADEYFDKFQFTSRPELLREVARELVPLLPADVEVLAGLELGGVPLAAALSLETGVPAVYVRKEAKAYGTRRLAEGVDVARKYVVVVEDVITSGGQVLASVSDLRREGAVVDVALVVVDRVSGGGKALAQAGVELRALFSADEVRPPTN